MTCNSNSVHGDIRNTSINLYLCLADGIISIYDSAHLIMKMFCLHLAICQGLATIT